MGYLLVDGKKINDNQLIFLLEKMQSKLVDWKSRNLSMTRRVVLAKFILDALPNYNMQVSPLLSLTIHKKEKKKSYDRFYMEGEPTRD